VTIAIRPSLGVGRGSSRCDLGQSKTRIFLQTGLDRKITSKPVGQISKQLPGGVAVADYATLISPTGYDCSLDGNTDQEMIVVARHRTKRQRYSICPGAAAAMIRISLIAALACCTATMAAAADDLYRAQTIVTGQSEANRIIGFASCLEDDLIKVSGAQKLAGDPRLAAYKSSAGDFVKAHSYHDQMSGTPTRDEQGTRDRPYDLIVDFDEDKIDDILSALGLKPWLSHRPVLGVFVEMEQGPRKYIVTADAKQSDLQRESLLAAAAKRGVTIVLPSVAALAKSGINAAELGTIPSSTLASRAAEQVRWSGGWCGTIRISDGPQSGRWSGRAGRTDGSFAVSRSMKPSDAASAALPKSCRTTVIRRSAASTGRGTHGRLNRNRERRLHCAIGSCHPKRRTIDADEGRRAHGRNSEDRIVPEYPNGAGLQVRTATASKRRFG